MTNGERGVFGALWGLLRTPVPPGRRGYLDFGWLILPLFLLQVLTGILLSMHYEPSVETAAASVRLVMQDVDGGWLVRGAHRWASTSIVVLALLHLLRVFATGSYRGGNAASWHVAVLVLLIAFAEAFSGQLLPWDNASYWTVVRFLEAVETVPLVGPTLTAMLRGGHDVTSHTLHRLHAVHVMVLPWLAALVAVGHLWLLTIRSSRRR
jgi:quinol-cytochrome oxidoreductase complex cytochrome b subunit